MKDKKLSENYEVQMSKREVPECYRTYKVSVEKDHLKCGTCWFAHDCKKNKSRKK